MVVLTQIRASNSLISTTLPSRLVAVFVGATSGIGEYSLLAFAKNTQSPKIYFTGRSQEAADRIKRECETANPSGEYVFIRNDTSLIKNVDEVCDEIKRKEKKVNLLFMTQGTLATGTETTEKLHRIVALGYYARTRFILNLLPLIREATSLRRVVTVLAGTKEGPVDVNDIQGWKISLLAARGHITSMITLNLEEIAKSAPEVSFIHNYPGYVRGGVLRETKGVLWGAVKLLGKITGPFKMMPDEECGERQLYFATSARFPAKSSHVATKEDNEAGAAADGIAVSNSLNIARGTDGQTGSGVYSIDEHGESAGQSVEDMFAKMRTDGTTKKLWDDIEAQFKRITGSVMMR